MQIPKLPKLSGDLESKHLILYTLIFNKIFIFVNQLKLR